MVHQPPQGWPNRAASRFIRCRPHDWHVQEAGTGPTLLLLHGAGGATQSWRGLFPLLAARFHVVAPDLPGQGFTTLNGRRRAGLDPMSRDLVALCNQEGWRPVAIVGHSAGAAVALRIAEMIDPPPAVIGLNAALGQFRGLAGWLFPVMAKVLALNPLTPWMFSRLSGGEARVRDLLASTGSRIDAEGIRLYRSLVADPRHVDGTLAMMAEWRLDGLLARLPQQRARVLLIVGDADGTVPPDVSRQAAARMPDAEVVTLAGLGHLAHEEAPDRVVAAIGHFLQPDP